MFEVIIILFQIAIIVTYIHASKNKFVFKEGKVITVNQHKYRILKVIHIGKYKSTAVYSAIHNENKVSFKYYYFHFISITFE